MDAQNLTQIRTQLVDLSYSPSNVHTHGERQTETMTGMFTKLLYAHTDDEGRILEQRLLKKFTHTMHTPRLQRVGSQ